MSLTRILQTARKLGTPVIVTDREGEAVQVIMPFDDFAALVGEASSQGRAPVVEPSLNRMPYQEAPSAAMSAGFLDPFTGDRSLGSEADFPSSEGRSESAALTQVPDDTLEEKFFLEPLEDEESIR